MFAEIIREKGLVSCRVTLEREQVDESFNSIYREAATSVKIPGFRRGKAPTSLLKARLDQNEVQREVARKMIPEAVRNVLERYELKPLDPPSIGDYDLREGHDFTFSFSFVETPTVQLGEYKGLAVTLTESLDPKELARKAFEDIRKSEAQLEEKESAVVSDGDVVEYSLEVRENGELKLVRERGLIDLSDPDADAALKDNLPGLKSGEEKEFEISPSGSESSPEGPTPQAEPSTPPRCCKLRVMRILEKKLPELTDEWVSERFGHQNAESTLSFMESQAQQGEAEKQKETIKRNLLEKLCQLSQVDVPAYTLVKTASSRLTDLVDQLRSVGVSLDATGSGQPGSPQEVFAKILDESRQAIQEQLVISEVAAKEGIEASQEELDALLANTVGVQEDDQSEYVSQLRARLRSRLLREKVLDFLYENAIVEQPSEHLQADTESSAEPDVVSGEASPESHQAESSQQLSSEPQTQGG